MGLAPGQVRDAVDRALQTAYPDALTIKAIHEQVCRQLGAPVPRSSVRSSINLRPTVIERTSRGHYRLARS
jgi:hypothetical protein